MVAGPHLDPNLSLAWLLEPLSQSRAISVVKRAPGSREATNSRVLGTRSQYSQMLPWETLIYLTLLSFHFEVFALQLMCCGEALHLRSSLPCWVAAESKSMLNCLRLSLTSWVGVGTSVSICEQKDNDLKAMQWQMARMMETRNKAGN